MRSTMQDTPLSLTRLLHYATTVHARSEAVTCTGDGSRRMTYADLGVECARLAGGLRSLGVTGHARVGSFMWNNVEHLAAFLAVPSMGAVLHTLNIRLVPEQVAYIANHAADDVVLVDASLVPLFAPVLPRLATVRHVVVVGDADPTPLAGHGVAVHRYAELLAGQPEAYDWVDPADETDAAVICYTSGTTGSPKGVVYSHRSIWLHSMQACTAESFGLRDADRVLAVVPMFHAVAWGLPYAAAMSGASLLLPDRFLQAEPLARFVERERATFAGAVPTVFADLLHRLDEHPADTSSLTEVVIGGSACPPALMRAYHDRHGIEVIHAWGMTELSPLGSVARPPAGVEGETGWRYRETQGRIPASVQARLVGPDGDLAPHDGTSVGELEVRGPWVTGAYLLDDDPAKFHDGWLRTGDVGVISPDGYLTLTDRSKDVIKSGGEWISSVELENHLMAHPAVREASVVGVPDDRWGERPLATIVVKPGCTVTVEELRSFLAGRVARWQLPERWAYIAEVPKTSVGKFDKKVLRQRYADGELAVEQASDGAPG